MANYRLILNGILALGLTILFSACEQDSSTDVRPGLRSQTITQNARKVKPAAYTTYLIQKGEHSATNNTFKSLRTNTLRFEAIFDQSAIYTSIDPVNQWDINKLYGMADCSSSHQTNSARFGWRWLNDQLEIHGYVYHNGNRASAYISTVDLNKAYTYELRLDGSNYIFRVNGAEITLPRGCSGTGNGYQLYPYFGGDEVAPHDITIKIRQL
ncbi:hypothetical protein [Pontibacter populi]|uniref:Uncharacterized protein n=1 Tax=Pontibacter populi TaxID=890055 RepID=A0ABV1RWC4_9BACT